MTNKIHCKSTQCTSSYPAGINWDASVVLPVVHSAPFKFSSTAELIRYQESENIGYTGEYGRIANPTIRAVETHLAELEGAQDALLLASGMAAITTTMLCLLRSGDHVVITDDCYKRTRDFCTDTLAGFNINCDVVPVDTDAIEKVIGSSTKMIFTESPTNPYLKVIDLEKLADLGKRSNILTIVDSTFATPVNSQPLSYGIDMVIHSCTKYLGGHNDLIAGAIAGRQDMIEQIRDFNSTLGAITTPETAYMLERGLKTLNLRVNRQNDTAMRVAQRLESHPRVQQVFYPGLESHPHNEISLRQMSGFGGVISFLLDDDFEGTAHFIDALKIPAIAPSLGGVESLVEQPVLMGYWDIPRAERERLGMYDNLVRLSTGLEDVEELLNDIESAFAFCAYVNIQ